jgi:carbonic anhydrase
MKALLHPEKVDELPAVRTWMMQAESTRRIIRENFSHLLGEELLVTTIQENVRVQLDHLVTHPAVASRVRRGTLTIHGWVYSIPTGAIWTYDDQREEFVSLVNSVT